MKQAAIFLNGTYAAEQHGFYGDVIDNLAGTGLIIAVDGALELFWRLGKMPSCVLGDFDSVSPEVLSKFPNVKRIEYPVDKDATDGELAIRYALDQGCDTLEIFGSVDSRYETDQMLANFLSLAIIADYQKETGRNIFARLVDHRQHIYYLADDTMKLAGKVGDLLSIVPLSQNTIVSITGTKWELHDQKVRIGSSLTLRKSFVKEQVTIQTKGRAVVVHHYS